MYVFDLVALYFMCFLSISWLQHLMKVFHFFWQCWHFFTHAAINGRSLLLGGFDWLNWWSDWLTDTSLSIVCDIWTPERLGAGRLGAALHRWHVIEINSHIVSVKIVIVSKLSNELLSYNFYWLGYNSFLLHRRCCTALSSIDKGCRAATCSLKSPKVPFNTWSLMSLSLKKWSLKSLFLCNWQKPAAQTI